MAPRAVNVTGRPGLCQLANASAMTLPAASHNLRVPPAPGPVALRQRLAPSASPAACPSRRHGLWHDDRHSESEPDSDLPANGAGSAQVPCARSATLPNLQFADRHDACLPSALTMSEST